jgi:hypothetical protein
MRIAQMRWAGHAALALASFVVLAVAPARAEGSLGLDDVLVAVGKSPNLVAEIQAGRAAPYQCDIGKRSITIEADRVYFDARGKSLGDVEKADQKRAKTFQESNFRWTWTP